MYSEAHIRNCMYKPEFVLAYNPYILYFPSRNSSCMDETVGQFAKNYCAAMYVLLMNFI